MRNKAAGKQDAKPALSPKLRFPEFRDDPGWEQVPLDQLACRVTARNHGGDCTRVLTNSAERGVLDQRDYFDKDIATAGNLEGYYVVNRGDYVYNPRISNVAPVGPISRNDIGQGVMSPLYTVFRFNSENTDFYSHYFKTTCWHSYLRQVASTGARHDRMSVSVGDFEAMPLPTPSLPEQQRIAECLSSLDELIAVQARKLDAIKTHKKGLMQQLFPREGETVPRLRFPEFREAGEWTNTPLGNLLAGRPDYGVNAAAVPFSENLPKYLRITDISEDGRYLPDKQVSVALDATDGNYLDEGDIVLARTGASVGKSYRYKKEDGKLVFAGFLIRVKPDPTSLISNYLANFLTTDHFWRWVAVTSARSGQPGINSTEYSSLAIPLPPDLFEQQRIADFLSSLDEFIIAETKKLEALKTHKKGLMQQLFPSSEEVET